MTAFIWTRTGGNEWTVTVPHPEIPGTVEYMRAWEERLGPELVGRAISLMRANGWGPESTPPMWCWAAAFHEVEHGDINPRNHHDGLRQSFRQGWDNAASSAFNDAATALFGGIL